MEKPLLFTVTLTETGEKAQLTYNMVTGVTENPDGTATIHTQHEGSQRVNESVEYVNDCLEKLSTNS
jgi:hypothetical protein